MVPRKCPLGSPVLEMKKLFVDCRKLNAHLPAVLGNDSSGAVTLVSKPMIDEMLARLETM